MIKYIIKRDGSKEKFNPSKITDAIIKAMKSVDEVDEKLALKLTREVVDKLREMPDVEEVQDKVISTLMARGLRRVATSYSLYRKRRAMVREEKGLLGVKAKIKLSLNAIRVLKERYLLEGETPEGMFRRVAHAVASAEKKYGGDSRAYEELFYEMMSSLEFLPNSPTLMNASTKLGQLSACFVLPVGDSLESIFTTLKHTALIHHSGGGVGFNFSSIRPRGDVVSSTKGVASGPLSFMRIFDVTTDVIKQGGRRRGANMAVLDYNHPDILEFVNAKADGGYDNFNFSVSVSDSFMRKVVSNEDYFLINPRTGNKAGKMNARYVFYQMVHNAWEHGDPGILFMDEINRKHPLKERINATNPCAEQPLLPYESCNLGSINLSKLYDGRGIDWRKLEHLTRLAVRFLDDVIDVTRFPFKEVREKSLSSRKIGLGVMGFADLLIQLKVPYDSQRALKIAHELMSFIHEKARDESRRLGEERGSFPAFKESRLTRYGAMRNATVTTIAPTGTISLIADCSSGIEPLFAVNFTRHVLGNARLIEINKYFEREAVKRGFYSEKLMREVARTGSIQHSKVPDDVKKIFRTSMDISPEWHVKMQAAFQQHVDNAVSKTVNLPANATIKDAMKVFMLAYKLKCKGITVYRYGSKENQVLTFECPKGGACD